MDGSNAGRFQLLERLGAGGAGEVWRAFDRELGREVALKRALTAEAAAGADLQAELRVVQHLNHPGLVVPIGLWSDGSDGLLISPLVDGSTLDVWLQRAPADPAARWQVLLPVVLEALDALSVLHGQGVRHGDVKPSNLMIGVDGRARWIDLGLAQVFRDAWRAGGLSGGTLAYAAPELLQGYPPGPEADLFGLGAVVFEALTGQLPVPSSAADADMRRLEGRLDTLASRWPAAPPLLQAWMVRCLHAAPSERPTALEALAALGGAPSQPWTTVSHWVGRERELEVLRDTLDRARADGGVIRVTGVSGIGKSTLLRHVATGAAEWMNVVWGAPHMLAEIPYNAVDEALRAVAELAAAGGDAPPHAAAHAAVVFPQLRAWFEPGAAAAQPEVRRQRALDGLVEVLRAVCRRRPVLWVIDDAQWADQPSVELIRHVLDARIGGLVLVISQWPSVEAVGACPLDAVVNGGLVLDLALGPLEASAAEALRAALGGDGGIGVEGAVLRLRSWVPTAGAASADVVRAAADSFAALEPASRAALRMVAAAPDPLTRQEVRLAADLAGDGPVVDLVRDGWLSFIGADARGIVPAGSAVSDLLSACAGALVDAHRSLLTARRSVGLAGPASLWVHARGAEARAEAAVLAVSAAELAERALAFGQAVSWYERAREDGGAGLPPGELDRRHADALVNAGRGAEAVGWYRAAAESDGDPKRATHLRALAAEYEVRAGRIAEGHAAFTGLLAEVGEAMPAEDRFASREALWRRLRSLVFGWRPKAVRDLGADTSFTLDLLRRAATAMSGLQPQLTDCLSLRVLDRAQREGSRRHLILALGQEACLEAFVGGWWMDRRADQMSAWATEEAARLGDRYLEAYALQCRNVIAFSRCQWEASATAGGESVRLLQSHCPGTEWEVSVIRSYAHHSRWWAGDLRALREEVDGAREAAERRGDTFDTNNHRLGEPALAALIDDEHELVLARASAAAASWPDLPSHVHHYLHLLTVVGVHLYRGEAERAWEKVEAAWPAMVAGNLLALRVIALHLWSARGRAAVATGRVNDAKQAIRSLRRLHGPAGGIAALLEAGLTGRAPSGAAADAFARAPLWSAAARWRAGGGLDALRGLGLREPERFGSMLAPVAPSLPAGGARAA